MGDWNLLFSIENSGTLFLGRISLRLLVNYNDTYHFLIIYTPVSKSKYTVEWISKCVLVVKRLGSLVVYPNGRS